MSTQDTNAPAPATGSAFLTWLACLVALAASAGSVYLSMGMGLKACPLCFYQRTLVFAVFGVLLVGLVTGAPRSGLCLLALPLAAAALGVAGYHVYLELTGALECPPGIKDIGTSPQQSLAAQVLLTLLLALGVLSGPDKRTALTGLVATALLGAGFAVALILSTPPQPPPPPPTTPVDICRPPAKTS
jgi:disulfide bond formation protein DsbB